MRRTRTAVPGISILEYAMLAEEMGRVYWPLRSLIAPAGHRQYEALLRLASREQKGRGYVR